MANFDDLANYPVMGGDISFTNFGVSTIPAGTGVLLDPSNDFGIVVPTASGGVLGSLGITVDAILASGQGRVRVYGVFAGTADGTITRGNEVQISDTTSKMGRIKAKGATVTGCGLALNSAVDGDPVSVLLFHALNA